MSSSTATRPGPVINGHGPTRSGLGEVHRPQLAHGARPVPMHGPPSPFTPIPTQIADPSLQPVTGMAGPAAAAGDPAALLAAARRPLRYGATVAVVGREGGAGRTTITRLLAQAYRAVRGEAAVAVDAVPLWGGLTAAADRRGEYSLAELAAMPWPPPSDYPPPVMLERGMAHAGDVPVLASPLPGTAARVTPRIVLEAISRVNTFAGLTIVDTVADPGGSPARRLILAPGTALVWVARATRAGLWGIGEALTHFENLGAAEVVARSVVAVIGPRHRWPAEAAAAQTQLAGRGVEVIRVPHAANPLTDNRAAAAARQLLAAVVTRLGEPSLTTTTVASEVPS